MEVLFSKNPILRNLNTHCIADFYLELLDKADTLNIATGFISNESIVELKRIVECRNNALKLDLFIGMNYLDGFTRVQYNAIQELSSFLIEKNIGNVYLSQVAFFHGKMYSFANSEGCLGAFVGSSNLGSFVGTSQNLIESDIYFDATEAGIINDKIAKIIELLGTDLRYIPKITDFKKVDPNILDGYKYVERLSESDLLDAKRQGIDIKVEIPLKTTPKSNLNTFFGAGKIKGKYSPRGWYEVELIIGQKIPNRDLIPDKDSGPFTIITEDGYKFMCERQGDYSKNFRSSKDLKILGRWIKGKMENDGVLGLGKPVTRETLNIWGKSKLVLRKTMKDFWLLSLE